MGLVDATACEDRRCFGGGKAMVWEPEWVRRSQCWEETLDELKEPSGMLVSCKGFLPAEGA